MVPAFNYNKILAFALVLHLQTLHVPSSLSIDRFVTLQFETQSFGGLRFWNRGRSELCFLRFFT